MVVSDRTRCQLNTFIPSFLYYFDNIKIGLTLASQWDNHVHCHNLSNETSETVLVPSTILISVHVFINLSLPFNKVLLLFNFKYESPKRCIVHGAKQQTGHVENCRIKWDLETSQLVIEYRCPVFD